MGGAMSNAYLGCIARQRSRFYFQGNRSGSADDQFVPNSCQNIAVLARLGELAGRKNSKLRAFNGGRGTDSVPGHQLHSTLFQIPLTDVYLDPRLELR